MKRQAKKKEFNIFVICLLKAVRCDNELLFFVIAYRLMENINIRYVNFVLKWEKLFVVSIILCTFALDKNKK